MINLHSLNLSQNDGYNVVTLYVAVIFCILIGILVIITKNPVVSVLFLITLFLGICGNLSFLGLNFIALSYLLVYVGAVSILFLFILMLINIRISEIISSTTNSLVLAITLSLLFFSTIYYSLPVPSKYSIFNTNNTIALKSNANSYSIIENLEYTKSNYEINTSNNPIYNILPFSDNNMKDIFTNNPSRVSSNSWDYSVSYSTDISSIGNLLYTNTPILLLLTGLVLLLCMIGSIIITVKS